MVKYNKDDGVEFFGGTVEAKHVICFGIADDSFDWTDGWTGKGQFWLAIQSGDDADNGFESDNNGDNNNLTPRSNPTIYNVTLIGDPDTDEGNESDIGMLLREGTAGTIRNFIITGFKEDAIDIDHDATFTQALEGDLNLASGLLWYNCSVDGCTGEYRMDEDDMTATYTTRDIVTYSPYVFVMDPELADPFNLEDPDPTPGDRSPAVTGYVRPALPPHDGFFRCHHVRRGRRPGERRRRPRHLVEGMDGLLGQLAGPLCRTRIGGPASREVSVTLAAAAALLCLAGGGCTGNAEGDPRLAPLHHTFPSPEALSQAVLTALAGNDVDTLRALPFDEIEFRNAVWPDLPASRPERNVPFDYAWGDLNQKSNNALRRLVARYGGRRYELVEVHFAGETTPLPDLQGAPGDLPRPARRRGQGSTTRPVRLDPRARRGVQAVQLRRRLTARKPAPGGRFDTPPDLDVWTRGGLSIRHLHNLKL